MTRTTPSQRARAKNQLALGVRLKVKATELILADLEDALENLEKEEQRGIDRFRKWMEASTSLDDLKRKHQQEERYGRQAEED